MTISILREVLGVRREILAYAHWRGFACRLYATRISCGSEQDRPVLVKRKIAANRISARDSTVPHPDQRERALHGLIPRCRKRSRRLCARSVGLTLMSRCKSSQADRRSASGMVRAKRSKSGAESFDLVSMEAAHAQGE